jgi:hypothetical protein
VLKAQVEREAVLDRKEKVMWERQVTLGQALQSVVVAGVELRTQLEQLVGNDLRPLLENWEQNRLELDNFARVLTSDESMTKRELKLKQDQAELAADRRRLEQDRDMFREAHKREMADFERERLKQETWRD